MTGIIMKFYWKEMCGKGAVAKLNTILRRELQYSPFIVFWANCLAIYFYGFITGDVVANLNNYGIEAVIPESERIVKTL
jgi:hypothetical protein